MVENAHWAWWKTTLQSGVFWTPHKPRHLVLLLALVARKYQDKQIQAFWEELGEDLGVSKETVRKWGYELRDMGLIKIRPQRGRDENQRIGQRNDRNIFKIDAFVDLVERAAQTRAVDRKNRKGEADE